MTAEQTRLDEAREKKAAFDGTWKLNDIIEVK
jgi:hypothetical protein